MRHCKRLVATEVRRAAAKRREVHRNIVSRRLAITASVRAAQNKKYG